MNPTKKKEGRSSSKFSKNKKPEPGLEKKFEDLRTSQKAKNANNVGLNSEGKTLVEVLKYSHTSSPDVTASPTELKLTSLLNKNDRVLSTKEAPMTPAFLDMLLSIHEVEKDPVFRTKPLEFPSVIPTLKYPNVIFVASPTGKAPPPTPGIIRMPTVSDGIRYAIAKCILGGPRQFSILIHEGTYIDLDQIFLLDKVKDGFALELVGLNNVRIVFQHNHVLMYARHRTDMTIRNVLIYDRRHRPEGSTIGIGGKINLELIDVIINSPKAPACKVIERTARINLINCVMKKCLHGFAAEHGGEIHMNNCLLSDMQACGGGRESSFSFRDTVFENCRQIFLTSNSRAVLDRCRLSYDKENHKSPLDDFNYDCTAIVVSGGSRCSVSRSSFKGFDLASCVSNFGSKLTLQHCHIETDSGLGVSMNGQVKVLDCTLQLEFIVLMHNVELGSVEFKRNRHLSLDTPKIVTDAKSADVDHDFEDAVTVVRECDRHLADLFPSAKEQSRFTRLATAELRKKGHNMSTQDFVDPRNHYMYKHCMRCFRVEDIQAGIINVDGAEEESEDLLEDIVVESKPEKVKEKKKDRKKKNGDEEEIDMYEKVSREPPKTVKEKFGYCRRCKKACYCSRECQLADWPDHKLLCETLTKIS